MASSSLTTVFERNLGNLRGRPPFGFSVRAWPFVRVLIAAAVLSLAFYVGADRLVDWQPQAWAPADRLSLLFKCSAMLMVPALFAIMIVAAQRLNPKHFNGTQIKPGSALETNAKFVRNTMEQFLLFVTGVGALALYIHAEDAATVPILTAMFLGGRAFYWWGYHHNTHVRAFGFGVTFYPLVVVYAWLALHMSTGVYISI